MSQIMEYLRNVEGNNSWLKKRDIRRSEPDSDQEVLRGDSAVIQTREKENIERCYRRSSWTVPGRESNDI